MINRGLDLGEVHQGHAPALQGLEEVRRGQGRLRPDLDII